jgi:hypothetical protein
MWRVVSVVVLLSLGGCGALPMALSAAGGAFTIMKDVLDIDVSWHQLLNSSQTPKVETKVP